MPRPFKMFAKGRVRPKHTPGKMNKLEEEYSRLLEIEQAQGHIIWWAFEAIKFRIAEKKCWYTPDFLIMRPDGELEIHETKGYMEDKSLIKYKVFVDKYPFNLVLIYKKPKKEGGGFKYVEM